MKFADLSKPPSSTLSPLAFMDAITETIPGWLERFTAKRTMDFLQWQENSGISGSLLEIGLYYGRYFSLLARSAIRKRETVIGIDTFQWVNEQDVLEHLTKYARPSDVKFIHASSTDLDVGTLLHLLGKPCRFISIDGSHEKSDVFHDLSLAEALLGNRGIVAVDDFLNPMTFGVGEAAHAFFSQPRRLVPFLYTANKLFLCRPSAHGELSRLAETTMEADIDDPRGQTFVKSRAQDRSQVEVMLWGTKVLIAS